MAAGFLPPSPTQQFSLPPLLLSPAGKPAGLFFHLAARDRRSFVAPAIKFWHRSIADQEIAATHGERLGFGQHL